MNEKEAIVRTLSPASEGWSVEQMERRLEAQPVITGPFEPDLCAWFACFDVCPPDG